MKPAPKKTKPLVLKKEVQETQTETKIQFQKLNLL